MREEGVKGRKIGRFSVFQRSFCEIEMLKNIADFMLFSQSRAFPKKRIMFFALPLHKVSGISAIKNKLYCARFALPLHTHT